MQARNITVKIFIENKDVTVDLAPYLRGLTFEDNLSGEADTIDIELNDKARLFVDDWFPDLAATLDVTLVKDGEELPLNSFEIDEVEASSPPSTFKIKAVSVSQNSALRQHDESKSWENVRLSEIAAQIAADSGVELFFEATDDPTITRAEQGEQSRLAFLEKICRDNFLALKVADGKLVIFDESELDKQEPAAVITRDESAVIRFTARKTIQDVYKSCEVNYKHDRQDELFQGRFDSEMEHGKTLKINKKETTVTIETVGAFEFLAGNVIELKNFGKFDGNYLIEKARHQLGNGYECSLELRRCLDY